MLRVVQLYVLKFIVRSIRRAICTDMLLAVIADRLA
jgi:hypothetical protein